MITKKILRVLFLLAPVLLFSCGNEPKEDGTDGGIVTNINHVQVTSPNNGAKFKLGEKIPVTVTVDNKEKLVKEITVTVNGKTLLSTTDIQPEYKLEILADSIGLGQYSITADVKVEGNEYGEHPSATVNILSDTNPVEYGFKVNAKLPHDPKAFTQGLFIDNGWMYEGTGQKGQSELRLLDFKSNKIIKSVPLDREFFGEGIAQVGDKIYQLTYTSHRGFVYDKKTFSLLKSFEYPTEGWGLTYDGKHLIMTDGTSALFFYEPENFKLVKKIQVADNNSPVNMLNELEYINGEIWANIWQTDWIIQIDPATGKIKSKINMASLYPENERAAGADVLNGIAVDPSNGKIYVTGKYWPWLFEIEKVEKAN